MINSVAAQHRADLPPFQPRDLKYDDKKDIPASSRHKQHEKPTIDIAHLKKRITRREEKLTLLLLLGVLRLGVEGGRLWGRGGRCRGSRVGARGRVVHLIGQNSERVLKGFNGQAQKTTLIPLPNPQAPSGLCMSTLGVGFRQGVCLK